MKILRSHTALLAILSIALSVTMIVPAQAMMIWCGMDMSEASSMMQMHSEMNSHSDMNTQQTESMAHCDSTDASTEEPTANDSSEHCSVNIDCNCIITQKSDIPASSVLPQTLTLKAQISNDLLIEILTLADSNEAFPPPIWNSASYSPPSLFLSNAAFLI